MARGRSPALPILIGAAATMVTLAGLRAASSVVGPIFLALVLVIAVNPLRAWLDRHGAPFWVCVAVPLTTVILLLLALGAALAVSLAELANLLPGYSGQFNRLVDGASRALAEHGVDARRLRESAARLDPDRLFGFIQGLLNGLLNASSAILLIVLVLVGMCIDATGTIRQLEKLSDTRPELVTALRGFARDTARYLVVSTVFGAIVAALDTVVLYGFGVPLPILWGLLAFLTNYIPNVGFVIGLAPPAALALLDSGVATMLWVILAYCVINFVLQSLIQPKFLGDAVGLSFTLVSISLILWSWVLGPLGAILAVPLSTLARALLVDLDPSKRWLYGLLSPGAERRHLDHLEALSNKPTQRPERGPPPE